MTEIVPFLPKGAKTAAANMKNFVRFCREDLTVFGADLLFDETAWDVSAFYFQRGRSHKFVLYFASNAPTRCSPGEAMPEPYASQVKAYVRYHVGQNSHKSPPLGLVAALRALLFAFQDKGIPPDLCLLDGLLLDHAVQLAIERISQNHGATIGTHLARLSRFLREKHLATHAPIDWRHGYKWHVVRAGDPERAAALMPSAEALSALPYAFRSARETRDVICTSIMALLSCAPGRINEVFALPFDCEIKPLTDGDQGYMLRWAGSKGHNDFAKGIPAVMADVAREAITRLNEHTAEARKIAAWYEANPGQLYLPDDCAQLRYKDLTSEDLARIVGLREPGNARDWATDRKIEPIRGMKAQSGHPIFAFRFEDIERAILSLLPRGFPILDMATGLRYSQALLVARRHEFWTGHNAWRCMVSPVTYGNVAKNFHMAKGVFTRLGLSNPEEPIVLKSHQLRHYLNTLAQRGGLTEMEIAAWSGRKDVKQNAAYDHRQPLELLEKKRRREAELGAPGRRSRKINRPVSKAEGETRASHGHMTEIGFCEHDFSSAPCTMFMDCLHCRKHVCVKGRDPRHLEHVRRSLTAARRSYAQAEDALSSDFEGAEEWMHAHGETIKRLEQLEEILSDPTVPDGASIRLAKSGRYSLVEQAMHDHQSVNSLPFTGTLMLGSKSERNGADD